MNKPLLVVVDDDPLVASMICTIAEVAGYDTLCAYDIDQFKTLIKTENPFIVVLDLVLPDYDGMEILRHLDLPKSAMFILISGLDPTFLATAEKIAQVRGISVLDTFTKPFKMLDFRQTLLQANQSIAS